MDAAHRPLADGWPAESLPQFGPLGPESAQSFPDFLVISPPKTGSTWLAANLGCHPEIFVPKIKEVRYFCSYLGSFDLDWYLQHFHEGGSRLKGEATPSYCVLPCRTIRLIRSLKPQLKLIFVMREPVSRAWSHAKHSYRYRENTFLGYSGEFEALPISKWQKHFAHDWSVVSADYVGQLRRWLSVFSKEQLFVSFYERLERDPQSLLQELFEFLGVSSAVDFGSFRLSEKIMEGRRGEIPPVLKRHLHTILQDRTRQLAQLLGEQFDIDLPADWNEILSAPVEPLVEAAHEPQGETTKVGQATSSWQCAGLLSNPAAIFAREFDDDYLADLLEMQTRLLEMQTRSTPRIVWQGYRGYNIVLYLDRFCAVAQALGPLRLETLSKARLEELLTAGTCVIAGSLAEVKSLVDQRVCASLEPILVEEGYCGFNVVSYDGTWYGLEQAEGPFDPAKVESQQYAHCFQADTREDLKEILRAEHQRAEAERAARDLLPQLAESDYRGFNIIACCNEYYAIRPGDGAFDIESVKAGGYRELFHGATLDSLKAEIDEAAPSPLPQLIEAGYCGFNIIHYDRAWYGLAQGEGAFDPAKVDKCQSGRCFASSSKEDLKETLRIAARVTAEMDREAHRPLPHLIEEGYCGFNIISYDETWYALAQGEGEFDPEKEEGQQYGRCFRSTSKEELKEILRNRAQQG